MASSGNIGTRSGQRVGHEGAQGRHLLVAGRPAADTGDVPQQPAYGVVGGRPAEVAAEPAAHEVSPGLLDDRRRERRLADARARR